MRDSVRRNVEFVAQIVVAIAVVVVAGLVIKRLIFVQKPTVSNVPRISAGERLNLPDVDWKQNRKTLVFFLNKDCHYCTTSAPFYRELTDEASKQNVRLLAILPNSAEDAKAYVESIKLPIDDIHTSPLSPHKIPGTPTVLFVNSSGTVEGVWFGDVSGREKQIREQFLMLAEKPLN